MEKLKPVYYHEWIVFTSAHLPFMVWSLLVSFHNVNLKLWHEVWLYCTVGEIFRTIFCRVGGINVSSTEVSCVVLKFA